MRRGQARDAALFRAAFWQSLQRPRRRTRGADGKRHPNVEDNVTIYPNATILGGKTTVGARSTIGGNVFLMQSVPPDSLVYYEAKQMKIISKRERQAEGEKPGGAL